MSLLDTILGQLGGTAPVDPATFDDRFAGASDPMMRSAPAAMPMDGGDQPPMFPGGRVPMPRERPDEAGPRFSDLDLTPPPRINAPMMDAPMAPARTGLAETLFGPGGSDKFRMILGALGGGLANVKNSPFAGEVFSQAAGSGLQSGAKAGDTLYDQKLKALDRALKMKQIDQLGSYRDDMSDARFGKLGIDQQNADTRARGTDGRVLNGQVTNQIRQQQVDQQGTYNDGRLKNGQVQNGIRQQTADARTQDAATRERVAPSTIKRNEAQAGYYGDRGAESRNRAEGNTDPSLRLKRADSSSELWYRPRINQLRDERRIAMSEPGTPAQRQAKIADVDRKMQALDDEYFRIKKENRAAHGLNEDGSDARPARAAQPQRRSQAPSAGNSGEMNMQGSGTQDAPYQPQSADDYDQVTPGSYYLHPDGTVRRKK